jgi:preprotein translocase subunit SecG
MPVMLVVSIVLVVLVVPQPGIGGGLTFAGL